MLKEFSKKILTIEFEVTNRELQYVLKSKNELDNIIFNSNSIISIKKEIKNSILRFSGVDNNLINEAIEKIKKIIRKAYFEDEFPLFDYVTEKELSKIATDFDVCLTIANDKIVIKGFLDQIYLVKSKLLSLSIQGKTVIYPKEWIKVHGNLTIFEIEKNTIEYKDINDEILKSNQNVEIIKIERIQNKFLWKLYQQRKKLLSSKFENLNEKWLFFGTKYAELEKIYDNIKSSNADDFLHFSDSAMYIMSNYSFQSEDKSKESIFFSRVDLGQIIEKTDSISKPIEHYKSIVSRENGFNIYVVSDSLRAYHQYLITFKKN